MIPGLLTLAGLTIREALRRRIFLAALVIAGLYVGFAFLPLHIRTNPFIGLDMAMAKNKHRTHLRLAGLRDDQVLRRDPGRRAVGGGDHIRSRSRDAVGDRAEAYPARRRVSRQVARHRHAADGLRRGLGNDPGVGDLASDGNLPPAHLGGHRGGLAVSGAVTTLTLFFSTFATYALSSSLSLIAAGVALAEDILHTLARVLNIPTLDTLSQIASYICAAGPDEHWISRGLDATGIGPAPPGSAGLDFSLVFAQRDPTQSAIVANTSLGDMGLYPGLYGRLLHSRPHTVSAAGPVRPFAEYC